jgi:hypothetical protein
MMQWFYAGHHLSMGSIFCDSGVTSSRINLFIEIGEHSSKPSVPEWRHTIPRLGPEAERRLSSFLKVWINFSR